MSARPDETTVGHYWIDGMGVVWKQVSYTPYPTASFRRADDPSQRRSGVVQSYLLADMKLLVVETENREGKVTE